MSRKPSEACSPEQMEQIARQAAELAADSVLRRLNLDSGTDSSLGISKGDDDILGTF